MWCRIFFHISLLLDIVPNRSSSTVGNSLFSDWFQIKVAALMEQTEIKKYFSREKHTV